MNLPKTFKCGYVGNPETYYGTTINNKVLLDWDENKGEPLTYDLGYFKQMVRSGFWKIEEMVTNDNVNHPSHYQGKTEVIDIIEQATTDLNGFHAYCLGNVIKYVMRHQKKGGIEDLKKASWYLNRVIGGESE